MAGAVIGRSIQKRFFPDEGRVANLDFGYSPADIDQLRVGQMPAAAQSIVAAKKRRRVRRLLRMALFIYPPVIALFAIIALTNDISAGRKWAIFLLGVGFCVVMFVLSFAMQWFSQDRHLKNEPLRTFAAAAVKRPDSGTVRFGAEFAAPSWKFSLADASTIENGAEYNVFHVHDVLVYLEQTR